MDFRNIKSKAVITVNGNSKEGRALAADPAWQKCPDAGTVTDVDGDLEPSPTAEPDGRDPTAEHPGSNK